MRILNENAMKNIAGQPKDVIVLLGNIKDVTTKERHDKVINFGIGKTNFNIGFDGQLIVKCPKTKVRQLLEKFPILEGSKHWQATHFWDGATT